MAKLLSMEPTPYVLKDELEAPEEEKTIWHLRPLTWKERADVQDGMLITEVNMTGPKDKAATGKMTHLSGTQSRIAVEKGLVKIENLRDSKGDLVKFDSDTSPERKMQIFNSIPPIWAKELAEEILTMSGLRKEEEKN